MKWHGEIGLFALSNAHFYVPNNFNSAGTECVILLFIKFVKLQTRADPFRHVRNGLEFHLMQFAAKLRG